MGNSLGSKKTAKVMKINGEELKLKTPVKASEVVKDYPGHVLLDSEAVKHYGARAKPLEAGHELKPKRLYFLVEPPRQPERVTRRVRSGINMSAKDRLESLMLARRSVSDLSAMKPAGGLGEEAGVRVKMRLPRAEVERLMKESNDGVEAAEKIVNFCLHRNHVNGNDGDDDDDRCSVVSSSSSVRDENAARRQELGHSNIDGHVKRTQKRVSFRPIKEGEIQIAVA